MPTIGFLTRSDPLARSFRYRTRLAGDPRFVGLDSTETQRKAYGNLASGATTLYSVPTGKRARLAPGLVLLHNPTAAGITIDLHHVPSGGTADSTNKLAPTKTVAVDDTVLYTADQDLWHVLLSGDALVANTGAAGLNAWLVLLEERKGVAAFSSGFRGNLGVSEVDLYAVPALRTAVARGLLVFNPSGGALTLTVWAKDTSAAGTDANELVARSIGAGAGAEIDLGMQLALAEDGRFSAKGSGAGLNVWLDVALL